MLNTIIIVLDVISALCLIITILLHSGRGSGLSDMFGGGSSLAAERPWNGRSTASRSPPRSCSDSARSGSPGAGTPDRGGPGPLLES